MAKSDKQRHLDSITVLDVRVLMDLSATYPAQADEQVIFADSYPLLLEKIQRGTCRACFLSPKSNAEGDAGVYFASSPEDKDNPVIFPKAHISLELVSKFFGGRVYAIGAA